MKSQTPIPRVVIGVAWYSEDQWTMLKLGADDRDTLDATYKDWEAGVQEAMERLEKEPGVEPVKVPVDVEALRQWCRDRGKRLDGSSRSEYVAEKVKSISESS